MGCRGGDLFEKVGCPRVGGECEVEGERSGKGLWGSGVEPQKNSKFMFVQMQFWAYFYAYVNVLKFKVQHTFIVILSGSRSSLKSWIALLLEDPSLVVKNLRGVRTPPGSPPMVAR